MPNDDGIIRIGTRVDVSSLRSGMAQAEAAVREASRNMAQAQEEFGAAAAGGNEQAATTLALYRNELTAAQANVAALTVEQSKLAASTRSVTSNYYAAMGASELFRGRIPIRAMERFVAGSQAVGTALQYAFPVIGAIALTEILVQAAEKLEKFIEDTRELAADTGTDWLTAAIGQMDGLADAVKQADDELLNLATDKDRLIAESQREAIKEIARTQGPAAGMRAEAEQLERQLQANEKMLRILQAQRDIEQQSVNTPAPAQGFAPLAEFTETQRRKDAEALKQTKAQISDYDLKDRNLVQQISDLQAEAAEQKDWISPAAREAQAAARKWQEQLQEMSRQTDALVEKASRSEAEALGKISTLSAQNPSAVMQSIGRQISLTNNAEAQKQMVASAEAITRGAEATKSLTTDTKGLDDALDQAVDDFRKMGAAQVEAYDIQQKKADALAEATLRAQEATRSITPLAAAQAQAALHARENAEAIAALNAQLAVEKQLGKDVEVAQTQNQIAQLQGAGAAQAVTDKAAIAEQVAKPWQDAFNRINDSWLQVQNRMFYTTRNIGLEFAKMGQQIFISIVDNLEKAAIIAAERELMMLITHQTANQAKVASDASAAAESNSISAASSLKEVTHAAAVAAAKAYSAMAAIPIAGPILGAVAAATTFAAVEAFGAMASFDTGAGYVPKDGVAMIHQGEMILPAPTASEIREGGGGGGDINITQHNNITAATDARILAAIRRNPHEIAGALKRHLRQAGKI